MDHLSDCCCGTMESHEVKPECQCDLVEDRLQPAFTESRTKESHDLHLTSEVKLEIDVAEELPLESMRDLSQTAGVSGQTTQVHNDPDRVLETDSEEESCSILPMFRPSPCARRRWMADFNEFPKEGPTARQHTESTSLSGRDSTPQTSVGSVLEEIAQITDQESGGVRARGRKPKRPCVYCGKFQAKLRRHMLRRHKDEEGVKAAVLLPAAEQTRAFEDLRKEGIFRKNVVIQAQGGGNEKLIRQRKQGTSQTVMCNGCKGFYSKKMIDKHKKQCSHTFSLQSNSVDFSAGRPSAITEEFRKQFLDRFRDDDCGNICKKDKLVILLGQRFWLKSVTKERRGIMCQMRNLGNLILAVNRLSSSDLTGEDLLKHEHFDLLTQAIQDLTQKCQSPHQKSSLKLVGYVLRKATKVLRDHYTQFNMLEQAREVGRFSDVLGLNWDFLFSSAQLECEQRRGVSWKPKSVSLEQDVKQLKEYLVSEIHELLKDECKIWDSHDFDALRNLLISWLTLFNARRSGEPARMTVTEWEESEKKQWIDPKRVQQVSDPLENALLTSTHLAYMAGKRSKRLAPVLIPHDTVEPLRKLVRERQNANISKDNPFLFPNTGGSVDHALGWTSLKTVTLAMGDKLDQPHLLVADKFRHRASTLFALLHVTDREREPFHRHMGRSASVVYQCPLAVTEIPEVGGVLEPIDGSPFEPDRCHDSQPASDQDLPQCSLSVHDTHLSEHIQPADASDMPQCSQSAQDSDMPQCSQSAQDSDMPQCSQSSQDSDMPQCSQSARDSDMPQCSQSAQNSDMPQCSQSSQDSDMPQCSQSSQNSDMPQCSQSSQDSDMPQCSQSAQNSDMPQCSQSSQDSDMPQCSQSSQDSDMPQCSQSSQNSDMPQCSQSSQDSDMPQCSQSAQNSDMPQCSQSSQNSDMPQCSQSSQDSDMPQCSQSAQNSDMPQCSQSAQNSDMPQCSQSDMPQCSQSAQDSDMPQCSQSAQNSDMPQCSQSAQNSDMPQCSQSAHDSDMPQCCQSAHDSDMPQCCQSAHDSDMPQCSQSAHDSELSEHSQSAQKSDSRQRRKSAIKTKTLFVEPSKTDPCRRMYNHWNASDTEKVCFYFSSYIKAFGSRSTGSLPGIEEIKHFLAENPILTESALSDKGKMKLIKTKVFNERKKHRSRAKYSRV